MHLCADGLQRRCQACFPVVRTSGSTGKILLGEELRLSLRIFWRVALLPYYVAAVLATFLDLSSDAPYFMWGLAGVAFNQLSFVGRAFAALIAALMLLLMLEADRTAKPTLSAAFRGFAEHGMRFAATVPALAVFYIGWGVIQILLFNTIWNIPALGGADPRIKGMIFFTVTFVFAFVRLWASLLILTSGLKQSCVGTDQATSSSISP